MGTASPVALVATRCGSVTWDTTITMGHRVLWMHQGVLAVSFGTSWTIWQGFFLGVWGLHGVLLCRLPRCVRSPSAPSRLSPRHVVWLCFLYTIAIFFLPVTMCWAVLGLSGSCTCCWALLPMCLFGSWPRFGWGCRLGPLGPILATGSARVFLSQISPSSFGPLGWF